MPTKVQDSEQRTQRPRIRHSHLLFVLLVVAALILPAWQGNPWGPPVQPFPPPDDIPYMEIVAVEKDSSVTIKAYRFPVGTNLEATMGRIGTRGVHGIVVDTFVVDSADEFERTFSIPEELWGYFQIAVRLEETEATFPYFAYNWFYNNSTVP